jgi:hypothetical protein
MQVLSIFLHEQQNVEYELHSFWKESAQETARTYKRVM